MSPGVIPGRFITLEGAEGAGKSTQARRLADALERRGVDVLVTREPGGSAGAEDIRRLLVTGEPGRWDGLTEALLHFAARRDHLVRSVWPALDRGTWVVCDRFADSTRAYQGYGHGLDLAVLENLYRVAVGDFAPDLTVILDLPVAAGMARLKGRGHDEDRYERMGEGFHERLRAGFLDIAAREPDRCVVVDAEQGVDAVARDLLDIVARRFYLIVDDGATSP